MRLVKSSLIIQLRLKGYSFQKIAVLLQIPKGTAYRLYKKGLSNPDYSEKIGNKPHRSKRSFCPLWQHNPEWVEVLYVHLPHFLSRFISPNSYQFQFLYDYFLDFAYTTPQILSARNPINYFWGCVRKRICGVFLNDIKRREVRECLD